jgi:NRAMP (natural resistance-associated macrophage protein)-like metal ion transporter
MTHLSLPLASADIEQSYSSTSTADLSTCLLPPRHTSSKSSDFSALSEPIKEGSNSWYATLRSICGPGLLVCLADTDGGGLITAAQSGAMFGYSLLPLQMCLLPVLFSIQEMTIRLGLFTNKGLTELTVDYFGKKVAAVLLAGLVISCVGGIVSELTCIAAVGLLWGIPKWLSASLTVIILFWVVSHGKYSKVETIGVIMGSAQLVFVWAMFSSEPNLEDVVDSAVHPPLANSEFSKLVAANVGSAIMPWMVFYQQSALCDKQSVSSSVKFATLKHARIDTAIGSFITQFVMCSMTMTIAALSWVNSGEAGTAISSLDDIIQIIGQNIGPKQAKLLVSIGVVGACLVAALVISLAAAWGTSELHGVGRSLNQTVSEAPLFYGCYGLVLLFGFVVAMMDIDVIQLNVYIQILNSVMMPPVVWLLFWLSSNTNRHNSLPNELLVKGGYKLFIVLSLLLCSVVSIYEAIIGIIGDLQ